jgi:hypothetical protein
MRILTKAHRQEERQSWISGQPTEKHLDIEILRKPETAPGHFTLVIWRGNAGKPYIHYYYRTAEQREKKIIEEKQSADRRAQYKAEEAAKGRTMTQSAQTAAIIRKMLKKTYPHITFSVRSDNFANGNSVNVSWTDGIPTSAIDSFLRQFEQGTFDGMTDCYNMFIVIGIYPTTYAYKPKKTFASWPVLNLWTAICAYGMSGYRLKSGAGYQKWI